MRKKLLILLCLLSLTVNAQWQSVDLNSFSSNAGTSLQRITTAPDNSIYIAFRHDSFKLNVIKYDGMTWSYVGAPEITGDEVKASLDIKVNENNIPYVVYTSNVVANQKLTVQRFVNNVWETVGNTSFTPSVANNPRLTFDSNNIPYVVFEDAENGQNQLSVMKLNGNTWELVGNRMFSGESSYTTMVMDQNDIPYVAFSSFDNGNSGKTSVMKFDNGSWEIVGTAGFSNGFSRNHSLAVNSMNEIHVAFHASGTNGGSSHVLKFNGTSWEYIGDEGMNLFATEQDLFIDANDNLYVSYTESGTNEIGVRRYRNNTWELLENATVGIGNFSSLTKNAENEVHVVYTGTSTLDLKKTTDNALSTDKFSYSNVRLYPNPAQDHLNIKFTHHIAVKSVEMYNALGQKVPNITYDYTTNRLDIGKLNSGLYILSLESSTGDRLLKKIVKK